MVIFFHHFSFANPNRLSGHAESISLLLSLSVLVIFTRQPLLFDELTVRLPTTRRRSVAALFAALRLFLLRLTLGSRLACRCLPHATSVPPRSKEPHPSRLHHQIHTPWRLPDGFFSRQPWDRQRIRNQILVLGL